MPALAPEAAAHRGHKPKPASTMKAASDQHRDELIAAATAAEPNAGPDRISGLAGCGARFVRDWRLAHGLPVKRRRRKAA